MAIPPPSLGNVSSAWDWGGASVLRHSIALRSDRSLSKLLTPQVGELGAMSIVDRGANQHHESEGGDLFKPFPHLWSLVHCDEEAWVDEKTCDFEIRDALDRRRRNHCDSL